MKSVTGAVAFLVMGIDEAAIAGRPTRLPAAEWLSRFTDFDRVRVYPEPPFLRMDPPTLPLNNIELDI